MTRSAPCPLCGRASAQRFERNGHCIHRCAACDFEFVHPVPSEDALRAVYERGYFAGSGHGYEDYFGAERAATDEKARVRLDVLGGLGLRSGARVLDVGCADGRFVLAARGRGYDARGVENSSEARGALDASIAPYVHSSLDEARAHAPFDAITLWDVLEHLPDPVGTLRSLRGILAPGALVGVVLPVIDNVNARRWPRTWDQYKPPEHLWFFSRRSLRETIERELGARTRYEAPAWRREARLSRGGVARLEAVAWRALERAGLLRENALVDSWMIVVRAPG